MSYEENKDAGLTENQPAEPRSNENAADEGRKRKRSGSFNKPNYKKKTDEGGPAERVVKINRVAKVV